MQKGRRLWRGPPWYFMGGPLRMSASFRRLEDDSWDTKAGYIATGDVTLPDGHRAQLHARLRVRIVDGEFQVLTEQLTPTPSNNAAEPPIGLS